ncbi:histidinol-phosphate transaminase [Acidihalobacter ferrooxydans]|uniref:Histidinol-phosphate aminotransferase n=1 Tax=Acidihalobacter ferrooxydans TaxID=1765967 RepID=A0A1P8UF41_9GAMM|nr:histidinol-phosphate transaminase [Acidihalobacter ferrooxydans]APZ42462.1 histidinol-phosphate transaminase [Acidihalobacter ferrooxydans]
MSRFWSPVVSGLTPYIPGEQPKTLDLVKLNTNEHPYGPSPRALDAMRGALNDTLKLYPDPDSTRVKESAAHACGMRPEQVFVGNGSDEVLAHAFFALFQQPRPLLFPDITYSFYPVYCGLYGIDYRTVSLDEQFRVNVADYAQPNGGIVIANPNAPTGRVLALADIERLLQANTDSAVLIDEAYIDFGGASAAALIDQYPNLLVVRTLSKSYALAGLRVGFALGSEELIEGLDRVKNSFNSYPLDRVAQAGASAALDDAEWFERSRAQVIAQREALVAGLQARGFEVLPSAANFVFARHRQRDAAEIATGLRAARVIVRHFKLPRIAQFLRISVGTEPQHARLFAALDHVLGATAGVA